MSFLCLSFPPGPDGAKVRMTQSNAVIDEIEDFWHARYLSAGEAAWRILGFHLTSKEPAITALPVHVPDAIHHHQYSR